MKRIDITFPKDNREHVEKVLEQYKETPVFSEVERQGENYLRAEIVRDSADIDELIEEIRGITEIESGELLVEVLEQTTHVEKGKRHNGGSEDLSMHEMYTKAFDFSQFNTTSWALIALSAVIAVIGLNIENLIVVIGAMVIAPMLGPFISSSFGLVVGDKKIIRESLLHGLGSVLFAIVISFIIAGLFNITSNSLMSLIAEPGFGTVPLSLAVGSAAALAFSSEARETLAGVAVAIALVPPAAVAGITLASFNTTLFFQVSLVILSNIMSLILAGSLTFKLLGVEPRTSYRKNVSEKKLNKAFKITTISIMLIAGVVAYLSYQDLETTNAENMVEQQVNEYYDNVIQSSVEVQEGQVSIDLLVVSQDVDEEEFRETLENKTELEVGLEVIELESVA